MNMKNLMPEVAKLLGVEIGEEFKIDNSTTTYRLTDDGLLNGNGYLCEGSLNYLLNGRSKIIKLPWKPQRGEKYYKVSDIETYADYWANVMTDYLNLKLGNCFRTKEEAEANADRIRKEIMGI